MNNKINSPLDFENTAIAFSSKSDDELQKASWLFSMMNQSWLVNIASKIGLKAVEWDFPFAEKIVKSTIFSQFCGGTSLDECKNTVENLYKYNVLTILDYGAEAKESEADYDNTMNEFIKAIQFGAENESVKVVSIKVTGMARFGLLEKIQLQESLSYLEQEEWDRVRQRMKKVCQTAFDGNVGVFVDAEETWIQRPVDALTDEMMSIFNKERITIYNTFQLYLSDRLAFLKTSFEKAKAGGYILGAKLVRGAYMEKERNRAEEMGYPSPINPDKATTDAHYNEAVRFCIENYEKIASCCASHNAKSTLLQAQLVEEKGIPNNHPHLTFCQLYGMSDNLTFNLGNAGYNASKYMPYGTVKDVIPYLIRRAQENTSVQGDMGREYALIQKELERRNL